MSFQLNRRQMLMAFAGFLAISFLLYGQTLRHDFVSLDDPYVIVNNLSLRSISPETAYQIFTSYDPELYTPLTFFSYQISYLFGGLDPAWYHAVNILLHGLNAALVAGLIGLLLQSGPLGLFAGILFAVHPVNTEVAAWATARKESLSAFFMLLSMIAYVLHSRGKKHALSISIFAFLLALLSKVNVATLPALLFLFDFWERRPLSKKTLFEKIPYAFLSLLFIIIGLFPKEGIITATTLVEKILMSAKSTMFYLWTFMVPLGLSVLYPNKNTIGLQSQDFQFALAAFVLVLCLVLWSLKKTRATAFGFGFFLIALSPTFVHFNRKGSTGADLATGIQFASDHYMYVPMIGLLFLATVSVRWLMRETVTRKKSASRDIVGGCIALLIVVFGVLSSRQAAVWKNSETLFTHTLSLYPHSSTARIGLSVIYRKSGRFSEEKKVLEDGLIYGNNAKIYAGLAAIHMRTGDFFGAETAFENALRTDPADAQVHFGIGTLHAAQGKNDEAMKAYLKALSLDPRYPAAENNIGSLLMEQGNEDEAKEHFLRAVHINPTFREGYVNLGRLSAEVKQFNEAIDWYAKAIELDPNDLVTRIDLTQAYLLTGQNSAAFAELKTVLEKDPENMSAKAIVKEMVRLGILGNG